MFVSYMAKIKVVLLCHLFLFCTLFKSSAATDTLNSKSSFEVSFGQSLLFFSNSDLVNIRDKTNLVMPTSSMLFFAEFRCNKAIRIPTFFNLPTETKQFVDPLTKATVYEKPSPSIGTGLEYKLLQIKIDSKTKIEFEAGPLAAFILDKKNFTVSPLIAGRVKIIRGENFVMYMGCSYTLGINVVGMLYGTGSAF